MNIFQPKRLKAKAVLRSLVWLAALPLILFQALGCARFQHRNGPPGGVVLLKPDREKEIDQQQVIHQLEELASEHNGALQEVLLVSRSWIIDGTSLRLLSTPPTSLSPDSYSDLARQDLRLLDRVREEQFVVSHNSDCIAAYRRVVRRRSHERIFDNIYPPPHPCLEADMPGTNSGLRSNFEREQVIFRDIALAIDDDLRGVQQTLEGELLVRSLVRGAIPPQGRRDWMETRKRIYNIASYSEQLRNTLDAIKRLNEAVDSDDALEADEISKLTTRFKTIRETWADIEKEANLANFLADKK